MASVGGCAGYEQYNPILRRKKPLLVSWEAATTHSLARLFVMGVAVCLTVSESLPPSSVPLSCSFLSPPAPSPLTNLIANTLTHIKTESLGFGFANSLVVGGGTAAARPSSKR